MTVPAPLPSWYPSWLFSDEPIADPHGRAARVLAFAGLLKHPNSTAADRSLGLVDWQRRLLARIYGPSTEDGRRQVRVVFALLPRGGRKTSLGACLALAHCVGPQQRERGQIVLAASARDQARKAFDELREMIKLDPRLKEATRIRDSRSKLSHFRSGSMLEAIGADGDVAHGSTPTFVLCDELHCWKGERGRKLWAALKTGAAKIAGSLIVVLTTAGERPEGPAWDLHQYAVRVASGEIDDPSFLPVLLAAPPEWPWDDERTWHVCNPGLAAGFPDLDSLRDAARQAKALPALRAAFETYHLNRWGDGASNGWIDGAIYDEGAQEFDESDIEGLPCFIGVDLSKSYDVTAIVCVWPGEDNEVYVRAVGFLPEDTLRKRKMESDLPWDAWVREGHVIVTPGAVQDEQLIEDHLRELCSQYEVIEIAHDPYNAARMMSRLIDYGIPAVQFPQRLALLSPATKEMQRLILARKFVHGGNAFLRWSILNATINSDDSGNVRLSKGRSVDSIDAAVACAMAVGRAVSRMGETATEDPWFADEFDASSVTLAW